MKTQISLPGILVLITLLILIASPLLRKLCCVRIQRHSCCRRSGSARNLLVRHGPCSTERSIARSRNRLGIPSRRVRTQWNGKKSQTNFTASNAAQRKTPSVHYSGFNNLLTIINGYSGMLLEQLKVFDPLHPYALEIKNAGERAASLTKQLLAFSRKQVIEPRVFDLNTTIRQSAPMLQRLIGEDIALETHLDGSLGQILADPNQIQQVIMNLAVNARDAMPDGGRLEMRRRTLKLVQRPAPPNTPIGAGRYVVMTRDG